MMKANKQIGFIYKNEESIDKILKDGEVVFERGFLRKKTSTTLPITFGGVGKDLKDYKIYGNTKQNSTSGKNLIGFDDQQKTLYGITATFVDNVITLNGTLTQNYAVNYAKSKDINLQSNTNKSYILSYKVISGTKNVKLGISFRDENGTQLDYIQDSNATDLSTYKNISSSTLNATKYFNFFVRTKEQLDNLIIELQLEEGSAATEFEPYTGGQPSPNPDYPQEIINCGDRTKNLIDKDNVEVLNAYIRDDDTISVQVSNNRTIIYEIKPNTTYTISGQFVKISGASNDDFRLGLSDSKPTYSSPLSDVYKGNFGQNLNYTFTTTSTQRWIAVKIANIQRTDFEQTLATIQIEEGPTATSYEPYGYKIPVNVRSENLFDKEHYNYIAAYLSNTNKLTTGSGEDCTTLYIKCKPNTTYTVSKTSLFGNDRFCLFDTSSLPTIGDTALSYVGTRSGNDNSKNLTIITNSTAQYLCIFVKASSTAPSASRENIINTLQIVEGSTVPSKYIPYYNQTTNIYLDEPLRKIGEYSDYIDFANGKVVRNIGNKVLDGSETYYGGGAGTGSPDYTYVYTKVFDSLAISGVCPIFSSHFATIKGNMARGTVVSIDTMCIDKSASTDRTRFLILTSRLSASTTSAFKTWLSSNNVTVDYVLETPTEETITLPNIPTVEGNNTLNIETEITPSQVYIKYKSNS